MKKIIIALCAVLALTGFTFAETEAVTEVPAEAAVEQTAEADEISEEDLEALEKSLDAIFEEEGSADEEDDDLFMVVDGKVTLWDSTLIEVAEGADPLPPVKVTLETKTPVMLINFGTDPTTQGYLGMVVREGLAPAFVSITPAHMGEHYNLNSYTMDMMQDYIKGVVDGNYDDESYTAEILKSEGGNTYIAISDGDNMTRSISTIYDDFVMEIYQFNMNEEGDIIALTDEDKAFAIEVFQGIWTE